MRQFIQVCSSDVGIAAQAELSVAVASSQGKRASWRATPPPGHHHLLRVLATLLHMTLAESEAVIADAIPAELLEALKVARPARPFYHTDRGCQKGRKSRFAHGTANAEHIPHVSRHMGADGKTYFHCGHL